MKANRTFLGLTSRALMTLAGSLLMLSYLSVFFNPAKAWFLVIFGILFLPLFLLNLFLLLWSAQRRSKAIVIPLVALLPSLFLVGKFVQFSGRSGAEVEDLMGGPTVKLVSYNVGRFASSKDRKTMSRAACMDSVFTFLRKQDADVICLQEFYQKYNSTALKTTLAREFPGYNTSYYTYKGKRGRFGNVIISRFPIVGKGVIEFDNSANLALYADLELNGRTVRLYNCHLESYNISPAKLFRKRDRETLNETEEKMRHSIGLRPRQVDQILKDVNGCTLPTLVCGDFNDTPISYTYRRLRHGHKDSFVDGGSGFGATYAVLWPALRIDYVMHPKYMKSITHRSPHERWSDHYPVIVNLSI